MAQGPYTPPASRVADPPPPPRPKQVTTAVVLLWISLALGIPTWYLTASREPETALHPAFIVFMLIVFLLSVVLNILIYRERNWARILSLILVLLAIGISLIPAEEPVPAGTLENSLTVISLALDVVAMYFLFTKPGAPWFRQRQS